MAIVITKQPTSVAVNVNDTVSITLAATGDGLTYDWQYSANGTKFYALSAGASASNWTYDQPTLTFKGYSSYLKYYFRCKITDANGDSALSNIVRAINLAEAGAGFILPETMHSLAEAIRAKAETTDKILPADMAAMIEGLKSGGEVLTGTFDASTTSNELVISLGVSLPDCDNYVFFTAGKKRPEWNYILCVGGEITEKWYIVSTSAGASVNSDGTYPSLDVATGMLTILGRKMLAGTHTWYYVGLDEVYSE
jgi:hypothetical protein